MFFHGNPHRFHRLGEPTPQRRNGGNGLHFQATFQGATGQRVDRDIQGAFLTDRGKWGWKTTTKIGIQWDSMVI